MGGRACRVAEPDARGDGRAARGCPRSRRPRRSVQSILLLPLYPPAIVAKQVADIDRACGGRVVLGVGIGGEYERSSGPARCPRAERAARTDEAIPLSASCGRASRCATTAACTRWVKARSASIRRRASPAARRSSSPAASPRRCAAPRHSATAGCRTCTRPAATARRSSEIRGRRRGQPAATSRASGGCCSASSASATTATRRGARPPRSWAARTARTSTRWCARCRIAGTPDEVAQRIAEYVGAGARHFIFAPTARDQTLPWARLLRDDLVPAAVAAAATL